MSGLIKSRFLRKLSSLKALNGAFTERSLLECQKKLYLSLSEVFFLKNAPKSPVDPSTSIFFFTHIP